MGLGLAFGASAQMGGNETVPQSDIQFWTGTGSNRAVLAITWDDETAGAIGIAWGVQWNGNAIVRDLLDTMLAYDQRLSIQFNSNRSLAVNIGFTDEELGLDLMSDDNTFWYPINGNFEGLMGIAYDSVNNGDFIDFIEWTVDEADTMMMATIPGASDTVDQPADAAIAADDILYWVGSGNHEVILAVNWADTALAWGYRFMTDSVSVTTVMDDIAAADPRFSYTPNTWGLGNILFVEGTDTVSNPVDGNWMSTLNGNSNASAGMATMLANNDFFKWGDYLIGTTVDPLTWAMVFTDTIYAVSVPDSVGQLPVDTTIVTPEHGPFCGPVGTEGCDAIAADSNIIVGWATGIELNRGPQNISVDGSPLASYGTVDSAIGPATDNTMRAVSLGDGGTATVTFAHPIRNGEGPDFAVFENGFANQLVGNYSLELAFVEVSSDGERFVRFPATSLTQTESQTANAGAIDPTNINNLAGKYEVGYGTPFDLAELADSTGINIDSIVYVRIVDVVGSINPQYATYDAQGNIINDPWPTPFASSGFDLTGVAVMYEREDVELAVEDASIAATDIIYWVGEGNNEVVFAINWADSALAWGYRFSTDSVVVSTIISDIVEADPRLSIEGDATFVSDFIFVDSINNRTLRLTPHDENDWSIYFNMQVNHVSSMLGAGMHMVGNGDFIKFADTYVAVKADSTWIEDWGGYWDYTYVWPYEITPVSVPGSNNAIDAAADVVMSLYPNPATSVVNVTVSEATKAVLFDMAGRRVMAVTLREGHNTLDLTTLESGVYMLRTSGHVEKIVKR